MILSIFCGTQMIFSDETFLEICVSQSRFVKRRSEEPIHMVHTSQHRPFLRVMFWAAMHSNGMLQLVQVNGVMTSTRYVTILQQTVDPFLEERPLVEHWTFQQDNAPSHKAATTKKFLAENAMNVLLGMLTERCLGNCLINKCFNSVLLF
jgi:hypothetical protein